METYIRNIVFACPDAEALGQFYAQILGFTVLRTDWFVIGKDKDSYPRMAFDSEAEYRPPQWPDPNRPQQLHLDIPVFDAEAAEKIALELGATKLKDQKNFRVYSDPAGHPFCFYTDHGLVRSDERPLPGIIGNIVIDCFSPRALAGFYQKLLDFPFVRDDSAEWVTIAKDDSTFPRVAFQQAAFPAPRWPDPKYPQQIHLDVHVEQGKLAGELALRHGAIPLPAMGGSCPVFADPAGHPFCLCAPGE